MKPHLRHIILSFLALAPAFAYSEVTINGSLQHNGIYGLTDSLFQTSYDFPYLSNSYLDLGLQSHYVNAGIRLELMPQPLQGYEQGFAGAGIGNMFVQMNYKWLSATVGDVYAQYGNGLILRLYEDRDLGIDNSLRGGKIEINPYKGIHLEAIGGKQRIYWNCYNSAFGWDYGQDAVIGTNVELQVEQWSEKMQNKKIGLLIGASYVSKYQAQDTIYASYSPPTIYNLPLWVGAADVRFKLRVRNFNLLTEYTRKGNDPSADNLFSYADGEALLLSGSWSKKGVSVLVQVKRSKNMSFRSERLQRGIGGMINHLQPFTTTHTYALASLYPYSTQTNGEWAWQAEARYTAKKGTALGGHYGTTFHLNASHVRGLGNQWWQVSNEPYYTDIHADIHKRLTKQWIINLMYMYQTYNQTIVEGHGGLIRSNIVVADVGYEPSDNISMRAEAQYLYSRQGDGQWIFGLYELSLWQCATLSVADMLNIGGENYWQASASFKKSGHLIQIGFVKQRAGYNCTGGVCRYVPKQKGITINYTYQF